MVEHVDALDCPCGPITMKALGGGSVQVHREQSQQGERKPQATTCPNCATEIHLGVQDPWCFEHNERHRHAAPTSNLLRDLEDKINALPAEPRHHTGMWIERAAVLALLYPKRKDIAA